MRFLITLLMLTLAAPAQAQLQFESKPDPAAAPPGIRWLQKEPMSLFDLGMMELTNTANKIAVSFENVRGAVTEYRPEKGTIAVTFYYAAPYAAEMCTAQAKRLRDAMFPQRTDVARLAAELNSYFMSYGPNNDNRPRSLGQELIAMLRISIYMQGGICQLSLVSDTPEVWEDPTTAVAPPVAKAPDK